MVYDYNYIYEKLHSFKNTFFIGKTAEGRLIHCIPIGSGTKNIVFAAAFHSLEYLTAVALLNFAEEYLQMEEYHNNFRVFIIPMVNPDGVDIAVNGINPKNSFHREIINSTGIIDFTDVWQANSCGVDINHNFNADWKSIYNKPSPSKYGGKFPESEFETRALVKFLSRVQPELFIAFHSQGKEIYYDFNGMEDQKSKAIAEKIAEKCGYTVCTPTGTAAFGGAKDWYIKEFHKQAFTVELGLGKNPLPLSSLPDMKTDVKKICLTAIGETY